eukprot:6497794-Pyramimonas_sp.AAC.1
MATIHCLESGKDPTAHFVIKKRRTTATTCTSISVWYCATTDIFPQACYPSHDRTRLGKACDF